VSIAIGLDWLVVKRIGIGDTAFWGCIRYHSIAWFRRGHILATLHLCFGMDGTSVFFCYLLG
jgi:hypothetical protein